MPTYTWQEPVTNRTSGEARMTVQDMNRITQNINYLRERGRSLGFVFGESTDTSKTSWIYNDIISVEEWEDILQALAGLALGVGYSYSTAPNNDMTYTNINNIESITLGVAERLRLLRSQAALAHYADTEVYSGDAVGYRYVGGVIS